MPPFLARFRPRLLPTAAMIVVVAACVIAGNWQRERMLAKESLRAAYDAFTNVAPVSLPLASPNLWGVHRFRAVRLRGEYDAARQIFIDNRIRAGRVGYEVVTPLKLEDGRIVLVNRGWIELGASRVILPKAPPPPGMVSVRGRLNFPPQYLELRDEPPAGPIWQNLDPARFSREMHLDVLPVIVEETTATAPATGGLVRDWPPPDVGVERNRMYMLQWYGLAVLAVVLWLFVNWRMSAPAPRA